MEIKEQVHRKKKKQFTGFAFHLYSIGIDFGVRDAN